MRENYLAMSGSSEANIWHLVRLWDCILHQTLRDAYKARNSTHERHELDGRNSHLFPPTYFDDVATMFNSVPVLFSAVFSTKYGDPFHRSVKLKQPKTEYFITGASVKDYMTSRESEFLTIDANIKKSGQGGGSLEGNTVRSFVTQPRGKKTIANGPSTGYGFLRFIREGEFNTFVGVGGAAVAASMTNTPQIGSTANRGNTSERPRKNNKSDKHHEILTFLDHLIET